VGPKQGGGKNFGTRGDGANTTGRGDKGVRGCFAPKKKRPRLPCQVRQKEKNGAPTWGGGKKSSKKTHQGPFTEKKNKKGPSGETGRGEGVKIEKL